MATTLLGPVTLESGDHLARAEFHRRYLARPDIAKAELIQGVVYVASPVRHNRHGRQHGLVALWLGTYAAATSDVELSLDATLILGDQDEVRPDALLVRRPPAGTAVRLNAEGYLEGAPELIVEVAASSAAIDLHDKRESYERAGVQEYLVWRVEDQALDWFRLSAGRFVRVAPDPQGLIESSTFPGLTLAVDRLLAEDPAGVLAALRSPPH